MRYETMLQLYGQLDQVYTGILMGLAILLILGLTAMISPKRIRPFVSTFVLVLALFEYAGLFIFIYIGG